MVEDLAQALGVDRTYAGRTCHDDLSRRSEAETEAFGEAECYA